MRSLGRILILAAFAFATFTVANVSAFAQDEEHFEKALDSVEHESIDEAVEESVSPENGETVTDGHGEAAHGADAAHEKSAGLPQFDPSSFVGQIFWLVIAFGILYLVFARKSLPEISSVLESRQLHIQSDLDTAESLRREAESVHEAYEKALVSARNEASSLFQSIEQDIKDKGTEAAHKFHEQSMKSMSATENRIAQAKSAAMEDMSAIAADIARQVAEKIIGEPTDLKQAKTVVDQIHKRKAA